MSCGCLKPKCGTQSAVNFTCENDGRDVEFISLTEFLPRVTLVAKGVPDDVALEYIRQAAQRVARESRLLKRELYLDVQAEVRDYYLEQGDNEQVHYIFDVQVNRNRHKCGQFCGCPANCFVPLKACRSNQFQFEPPDKVILASTPKNDVENQLYVGYVAVPTQNACAVDKLLYDRYHDVVVNGALSDLLFMRQYGFSDPQMAAVYEQRFRQGISQAKIDVARDFETGVALWINGGRI